MSTNQDRIRKISTALRILLTVIIVALFAAVGLQLVGILWLGFIGGGEMTGGIYGFFRSGADGPVMETIIQFSANILRQGLIIAMLWVAAVIFRDVSKEYTPFLPKHTARLKVITLLMFALAIIPAPVELLFKIVCLPGREAVVNFQPMYLVFTVIFYCLAQIFEYGRALQQESDQTL